MIYDLKVSAIPISLSLIQQVEPLQSKYIVFDYNSRWLVFTLNFAVIELFPSKTQDSMGTKLKQEIKQEIKQQ